jgi:hypothetical protein
VGSGLSAGGGVVVESMVLVVLVFVGRVGYGFVMSDLMIKRLAWSSVGAKRNRRPGNRAAISSEVGSAGNQVEPAV